MTVVIFFFFLLGGFSFDASSWDFSLPRVGELSALEPAGTSGYPVDPSKVPKGATVRDASVLCPRLL